MDALRALTLADGLLALGSVDRHYTASKIFNCVLARRPMLTVFHDASPVVSFVRASGAGELVSYDDANRAEFEQAWPPVRLAEIPHGDERLFADVPPPPAQDPRV